MIKFKNVNVTFNKNEKTINAIKNVNLTINDGEICGIVGASGAGKSTLIRTINGLQKPTSGEIIIDDTKINDLSRKELRNIRKNVGMIFQHFNLISRKTVSQNIEFALKIQNVKSEERKKEIQRLLKIVGLEDKQNIYPEQLSGGQKQRVGIARALASNPKILLCDEATSALDVKTTKEIIELLNNINKELGITIVFITHQLDVAKQLFHRVAVIENGEIIEENNAYNIFANPKKEFTKELVSKNYELPKNVLKDLNEKVMLLEYKGNKSLEPIINNVIKKCNVKINILQGNIEYIQGNPIGNLTISVNGDDSEVERVYKYLQENIEEVKYLNYREEEAYE